MTETPNVAPAAPAPPCHSSKPACTEVMNHAVLRAGRPLAGRVPVPALRAIASVMKSLISNSGMDVVVCWRRYVITGGLAPDGGRILFGDRDVTRLAPHARCRLGIGRSYQIPQPFGGMTVFENVLVGATFGALNCMYSVIASRQVEIGTLRAIGFGGAPVVISVLIEALLLALVGGAIGGTVAYLYCDGASLSTLNFNTFSQVLVRRPSKA